MNKQCWAPYECLLRLLRRAVPMQNIKVLFFNFTKIWQGNDVQETHTTAVLCNLMQNVLCC